MLDFHELDLSTPRRVRMSNTSHPPERPEIGRVVGRRSRSLVLSVDGLCVAIVDGRGTRLQSVAEDLTSVMSEHHSPSGSLLLGPSERLDLSMEFRKKLANSGISVRRSDSEDLVSAAEGILNDFWRRQRVLQERYHEAQNRG